MFGRKKVADVRTLWFKTSNDIRVASQDAEGCTEEERREYAIS
jgi:hypothetical protein